MTRYSDLMAYLNYLGLTDKLDTFKSRITISKIVYLLEDFGANLDFGYSWYIHGPYSPQLTHALFKPSEVDMKSRQELSENEMRIINDVRNFLGSDFYSVESLELLVSLVYLIQNGQSQGFNTKEKIIV